MRSLKRFIDKSFLSLLIIYLVTIFHIKSSSTLFLSILTLFFAILHSIVTFFSSQYQTFSNEMRLTKCNSTKSLKSCTIIIISRFGKLKIYFIVENMHSQNSHRFNKRKNILFIFFSLFCKRQTAAGNRARRAWKMNETARSFLFMWFLLY